MVINRPGWVLRKAPVLITGFPVSLFCLVYAFIKGLPGLRFDLFGRSLAVKRLLRGNLYANLYLLLHPVSGIRYFEFDFADRALQTAPGKTLLDISSPRLFPFWAATRRNFKVIMVNPDRRDLQESKSLLRVLNKAGRIEIRDDIFATKLAFADNTFDILSCISVIEHLNDREDSIAIDEFVRVLKPGGKIILTFPVNYRFFEEFRTSDPYGTQDKNNETGLFFFQRFYDEATIASRLVRNPNLKVIKREYIVEKTPGWFNHYIKTWQKKGLAFIVKDPLLMVRNFTGPTPDHPSERVGNCQLLLEVTKP